MSARKGRRTAQPRGEGDGRFIPSAPVPEAGAPLLEHLRFIARATVRRVYNDPRTTTHVERCVLHWLMHWDPVSGQPIRQHIGLMAGNEARKVKAMKEADRTQHFGRSNDLMRLVHRSHRPERNVPNVPTEREGREDVTERNVLTSENTTKE